MNNWRKDIIEQLKKENIEKKEIKPQENTELKKENFSISKNSNNKKKYKKFKKAITTKETPTIEIKDDEFLRFKEEYLKDKTILEFIEYLESSKKRGDEVFEVDFMIKEKMKHPKIRVMIIEPSADDLALGKGNRFLLVKPIYQNEYMEFVKTFGPRESNPGKFMEFSILNGVIFPSISEEEVKKLPTGTALTIYRTITDISDFNKQIKILEM